MNLIYYSIKMLKISSKLELKQCKTICIPANKKFYEYFYTGVGGGDISQNIFLSLFFMPIFIIL